MTFRQIIRNLLRTFVLEQETASVIEDIATNGLTSADEAIIDAFLDTTPPAP